VKYSDPSGHFVQLIIAGAFAAWTIYDAYKEYKSVKSKGYSNGRITLHMTGYVAKDVAFGKVFKSLKIGKRAVSLAKKIFKSKVVQKAIQKARSSSHGRTSTQKISNGAGSKGGVKNADEVGLYLAKKAPNQVTPGTRVLEGQYIDDMGRVQPWEAHYDQYGRLVGRTDYNAGNKAAGIPDTHYHTYEWGPGKTPLESGSHIEGVYKPK